MMVDNKMRPACFSLPSRRRFLQSGAAVTASAVVSGSRLAAGSPAASDRITVGVVGLGSRGFNLIDALLKRTEARIVAICDVDELHYRDRAWGKGVAFGRGPAQQKIDGHYEERQGVFVTHDFRELCQRPDLDVVVVATPDHWHALCTLEALRNGKDVYCEKPVTHTFREGQQVYREVAARRAIFQTGSQQRSDAKFRRAVELVRNGLLGAIERVEVGLPPGYEVPQGDESVVEPPDRLDYDLWCGPAPKLPYMRARHHRWWRGHTAYGGGVLMDWIGHHNDIAHWALDLDRSGPEQVEAVGWTQPATDIYDTPHRYTIRCRYGNGIVNTISTEHQQGVKFIGDEGWLHVTRGKISASDPRWIEDGFVPGPHTVYVSNDHMVNFLNCVKSRETCIAPAETSHRSITPGHLGYVSQALGRALRWDPLREEVVNDAEANRRLQRQVYRGDWGKV